MASVVYWLHTKEHTNMFTQGYVGITNNINARLRNHKSKKYNAHLKNAILKYGWDNIIKQVILVAEETYCLMIETQIRPKGNIGWNIIEGGGKPPVTKWNKGKKCLPHVIESVRKSHLGKKLTQEHKDKISKGNLGRKMSAQNKEALRVANMNRIQPMKGKQYPQITCPYCDKMGGLSGMKSWHFDNCKFKENT